MMAKKVKQDVVANTLITSADVALVIIASVIVSLVFIILSTYSSFVQDNDMIIFTLFEVVAFVCVIAYKRWKK
jgi:positive regulator of sigma E activity